MAVTLSAPLYSFVQLNETERAAGCVDEFNLCLPVQSPADLAFQIIAVVPKADESWFEVEFDGGGGQTHKETIFAKVCTTCDPISLGDPGAPTDFSWTGTWRQLIEGGSGSDTWVGDFAFNGNSNIFDLIASGTCFYICFHRVTINVEDATVVLSTHTAPIDCTVTCFQKIDEDCFTSFFTYNCKEDSFGFIYTDQITGTVNFFNQVRLPCWLRDPQFPKEEKSYRKSDGTRIKLFGRIEEEYEMKVDWMYKIWHKRLVVLLEHDVITIDNENDSIGTMGIVCEEKYEITWPEEPYGIAPAKTKVKRSAAVNLVNTNCR